MTKTTEEPAERTKATAESDEPIEGEVVADEPETVVVETPDGPETVATQELALREAQQAVAHPASTLPTANEWRAMRELAESISKTEFVPVSYRGRPDAVVAAVLAGRELGIGPMQALRDISIVDGRPVLAAHLMLALLRRNGVRILESESTAERAYIRASRGSGEVVAVEWTMEEAKRVRSARGSNLVDKDNWRNYPADMLWARAVGRLARRLGPDLLAGMPYTAEEVADFDDPDAGAGHPAPQAPTPRRVEDAGRGIEPPKTWQDHAARFEREGAAPAWITEAIAARYDGKTRRELTQAERNDLWQRLDHAYLHLRELHPEAFPPADRLTIQAAFAKHFDGLALVGPPYSHSPEEAAAGLLPSEDVAKLEPDERDEYESAVAAYFAGDEERVLYDPPEGIGGPQPPPGTDEVEVEEAEVVESTSAEDANASDPDETDPAAENCPECNAAIGQGSPHAEGCPEAIDFAPEPKTKTRSRKKRAE